jgi:hypothetical protein
MQTDGPADHRRVGRGQGQHHRRGGRRRPRRARLHPHVRRQVQDQIATCFRLDRTLHTTLVAEAKRSLRSLNSEMILRLRKSLEQQEAATV